MKGASSSSPTLPWLLPTAVHLSPPPPPIILPAFPELKIEGSIARTIYSLFDSPLGSRPSEGYVMVAHSEIDPSHPAGSRLTIQAWIWTDQPIKDSGRP